MPIYHFGVPTACSYDPRSALRESLSTSAESLENTSARISAMSSATEEPHKDARNVTYHLEKTSKLLEELTEKAEEFKEMAEELSHHAKVLSENGCDDVYARIGDLTPRRRDAILYHNDAMIAMNSHHFRTWRAWPHSWVTSKQLAPLCSLKTGKAIPGFPLDNIELSHLTESRLDTLCEHLILGLEGSREEKLDRVSKAIGLLPDYPPWMPPPVVVGY